MRTLSAEELDAVNGGRFLLNIQGNGNSGSDTGNSNGSGNHAANGNGGSKDTLLLGGVSSGDAAFGANTGNVIINNSGGGGLD
jgi:hypothetical protein